MTNICSIYARANGTIVHVADTTFPITPDADTSLVVQFSIDDYPAEFGHISANSDPKSWDGANLQINDEVYLSEAWIAARQAELTTVQAETTQANSAKASLQNLMTGLHSLSAEDKGYAIYCRLLAYRNNATQQVIFGIVDRATAAAYVTSLPQWTNVPATSKPMMQLMLETNAALTQVLLLVLSG